VEITPNGTINWIKIDTLGGPIGFIREKDIRSPLDYRAVLRNKTPSG
jgi:hypothetical protein